MKIINKRGFIIIIIAMLLYIAIIPQANNAGSEVWADQEDAALKAPPAISAQCAVVMELKSGRVLYEKNAHQKAYPASITKILTALVAIEEENLDKVTKVSKNAAGIEGSSIYLAAGEKISLRDLLYGLMLRSGNDAAIAISEAICPTKEEFVEKMNERAGEIGAVNSHFVNPNGLYNDDHYTTAYDMALITREAMSHQDFKTIVAAKSWQASREEGKYNYFYNKNKVVFQYDGGTGVKIGFTKASGRTLVASSERDGMELVCVVMNAPNWFQDSYKLMDHVYENYQMTKIVSGEKILKAIPVEEGDKGHVYIAAGKDISCPLPKGDLPEIAIAYDVAAKVNAPIARWEEAGKLQIFIEGEYLFSQPLYYLEDIDVHQAEN